MSRLLLAELARRAPLLPGAGVLAFIDIFTGRRLARRGSDLGFHVPCMSATWTAVRVVGFCRW